MTGVMTKPMQLIPGFLMHQLSFKLKMIQFKSEVRNNGKVGLKTSTTGVTDKLTLPTLDFHMLPLFSNKELGLMKSTLSTSPSKKKETS